MKEEEYIKTTGTGIEAADELSKESEERRTLVRKLRNAAAITPVVITLAGTKARAQVTSAELSGGSAVGAAGGATNLDTNEPTNNSWRANDNAAFKDNPNDQGSPQ